MPKKIPDSVLEDKINKLLKVEDLDFPPTFFEKTSYQVYLGLTALHRPKDVFCLDEYVALNRYNKLLAGSLETTIYEDDIESHGVKTAPKKHQFVKKTKKVSL